MSVISHEARITGLRDEYSTGVMYGENSFSAHASKDIMNSGFMGSANVVFLSSEAGIVHKPSACIAAPLVTMVAKNAISLGLPVPSWIHAGEEPQDRPFRLYIPDQLSITTNTLIIDDIVMLAEPSHASISCKRLFLYKPDEEDLTHTEEDPPHFEVVKSWIMNDDAEIETVSALSRYNSVLSGYNSV